MVLSLQLSFAVVPLVRFTSDKMKMGRFVNGWRIKCVAWAVTSLIVGLNVFYLWQQVASWLWPVKGA